MINKDDIEKMAGLARIAMTDEEQEKLTHDAQAIVGYIDQLNEVEIPADLELEFSHVNNVRPDENPHEGDIYKRIADAFPEHEDGYIKVPKVL